MAKQNQNLSSDDTPAERESKLAAAAEREREAAADAAEEQRKAAEKAQADADRAAGRKPTAAHPQVSAGGSEPPPDLKELEKTSQRPAETVKAGQSGQGVGGAPRSSKLTRAQMEDVIKQGGSVMHKGVIVTNIGHLPPEADLVQGDEEASRRVAAELDNQIAALQKQRDKLPK